MADPSPDPADAQPEPPADWCAPGFDALVGGCLAVGRGAANRPLIIYLHGRYARDASADELDRQRRLGARAVPMGFSVLALRGRLGTCTAPELADWYCWPSNERNADAAPAFVSSWSRVLATAAERTGARRRLLLGFSNGGYFAGLIASRGLLPVDAVVVAHAGPVEPVHATGAKLPILLLSADDDIAQDEMIRYGEELAQDEWPHDSYARSGGHNLSDEDIDAALTFYRRLGERLPLSPPLALHRPMRHARPSQPDQAPFFEPDEAGEPATGPADETPDVPVADDDDF